MLHFARIIRNRYRRISRTPCCMHQPQAINFFVQHSFNLNPAIMSAVELAMADHPITTHTSVHNKAKTNFNGLPRRQMTEEPKADSDPGELSDGSSGNSTAETKHEVSSASVREEAKIDSHPSEDPTGATVHHG